VRLVRNTAADNFRSFLARRTQAVASGAPIVVSLRAKDLHLMEAPAKEP